jgi:hypothetical protein
MPDWKNLVRERLTRVGLPLELREAIATELAAHLEDEYQDGLACGLSETEASNRILSQVPWNDLARGIRRAALKEVWMNTRTKTLWLPAMLNLITAAMLLLILEKLGAHPRMVQVGHMPVAFPVLWFFTLPLSAAAASLMARRAQAPSAVRLVTGLAPSLLSLAVFLVMALVFEIDRWEFPSGFPLEFDYFALSAVGWIFLPALPLLLGTVPFLRVRNPREAEG